MLDYLISENGINVITGIVTVASAITAITPTPKDDSFFGKFYKIIEVFALVVGRAKDKNR